MLLGPHDIARRLEYQHRPGWSIWYGGETRQYWALACWMRAAGEMFGADTPEALEAAMATFETRHPKPRQRSHALGDRRI
jgi:hypothetical protein